MKQTILGKLRKPRFLAETFVVCLTVLAMIERNTFGIRKVIDGEPKPQHKLEMVDWFWLGLFLWLIVCIFYFIFREILR